MAQDEALALLGDPAFHGGAPVERIDTHISTVFLAGERAYKVKKAVTLPFLDFATVEQRRAACLAELEVNRRAAPALYLGVGEVAGEPVVEMRRFEAAGLFDRQAAAGTLDRHAVNALTEAVVRFHQSAPVRDDRGGRAGLAWVIDTNLASMRGSILPADKVERLAEGSRAWLDKVSDLMEARRRSGFVRQCHGDLHLGNICVLDGQPTLFDAIEFSEDIACIDVVYDLAFLLMDLDRRAGRALASYALGHYLDLTGDYAGVRPLPLYLSLRSGVRAHVSATMAKAAEGERRAKLESDANQYLDAALAYLEPPAPRLLAVGGLSGSGKSRMGRELAPHIGVPGAVVVRSDALRKQLCGVHVMNKLGPEGYTPEMTERTYRALYDTCARLLADGVPCVADAVFARPEQRAAIEAVARAAGVPFQGLWLHTPPELAARRIEGRKANVSDATAKVLEQQLGYDLGDIAWPRVETGGSKSAALAAGRRAIGV